MKIKNIISCVLVLSLVFTPLYAVAKSTNYKKNLKKWTRSDRVYKSEDLKASIYWTATLLNNQMIHAQAQRYAEAYESSEADKQKSYQELMAKKNGQTLFFVSFYSGNKKFSDLLNPRAGWELRLESGGHTYKSVRIEKIGKTKPVDRMYFPYITPWSVGYYVWFPAAAESLTLSVYGPDSHSTLVWK